MLLLSFTPACNSQRVPIDEYSPINDDEEKEVVAFCSKCHQAPRADYFPKSRWKEEVSKGYRFYLESSLKGDTIPPDTSRTIKYYVDEAPLKLAVPVPISFVSEASPRFRVMPELSPQPYTFPWIAHMSWKKWTQDGQEKLVMADMHAGTVSAWDPRSMNSVRLVSVPHPAHMEWCDLDHDGLLDMIVADLGSEEPKDHNLGCVRWMQQLSDESFKSIPLAAGMGRVCETRVADFTGDGRDDILVAEFGWRKTGAIKLMERQESSGGTPQFQIQILDRRNGTMRVPPLDIDGDGDIDFVALIAQQHESVEVFLNRGDGRFDSHRLCPPADPAFGSSGLEAADLDHDGDVDFVLSNGDMFDNFMIKPYHQLRWLENCGGLKFVDHHLITMPGTHGAAIGDIDLDGDLDIVTAACIPLFVLDALSQAERDNLPSAVWLEQTAPGIFVPHALEFGNAIHACCTLADIDSDGDLDVLLGMLGGDPTQPQTPVIVHENLTLTSKRPRE